jgi:simple sugar transport system permease protein
MALIVWAFFKTKLGTAMTAAGSIPVYARAAGVNVDRMRVLSVVISTIIAAVGILVYEQSFGFIQLYMAPLLMAFPAVAALLLGGASVSKASMGNVIVGTFLFQGILTMTPSVMNNIIKSDMSEVIRIIVSNGMIVYALTRRMKVRT